MGGSAFSFFSPLPSETAQAVYKDMAVVSHKIRAQAQLRAAGKVRTRRPEIDSLRQAEWWPHTGNQQAEGIFYRMSRSPQQRPTAVTGEASTTEA